MSQPNKVFVPPAVVKKHTAEQPTMGSAHAGGTQYYQYDSNNEFEVLKRIGGHQQELNVTPVKSIKRFVG